LPKSYPPVSTERPRWQNRHNGRHLRPLQGGVVWQDKICGTYIYLRTLHGRHVLNMSSAASSPQDVPVHSPSWTPSGGTCSALQNEQLSPTPKDYSGCYGLCFFLMPFLPAVIVLDILMSLTVFAEGSLVQLSRPTTAQYIWFQKDNSRLGPIGSSILSYFNDGRYPAATELDVSQPS
jgi:hypothetical protein